MLNLLELAQFVSFAECGTLSKAAEQLHISQPTLTRTMRHVEDVFGVPLFHRGKNHLALNQTGEIAVKQARKLLENAENAVQTVQDVADSTCDIGILPFASPRDTLTDVPYI